MNFLNLAAQISLDSSAYEAGLNSAENKFQTFGNKLKSGAGKIAGLATKAVAGASTAVVGFGAASVKTGMTFDEAMSQVAATMGMTMEGMQNEVGSVDLAWGKFSGNLREYAQEMGANTAFSATQAAEALNYMALAGYDTQTSMEMLPNVLNLAAAGNMDLARASDMVTDTQTAFGISLERTNQMVDEMAKAASTGNTSVEQLGDAFLVVGGLAKELNGGFVTLADGTKKPVDGIQEMEIALTAMANAGVKGSEAGTHMRNMLMKLSSPTGEGVEQMEKLGVKVFDAEENMRSLHDIMGDLNGALGDLTQEKKIQAIADLFNARDLASAEALLGAVEQDWDKIGESILDAEGAAQKMAGTQLDNLAGDVKLFKSAVEGAQIAVSDKLSPALRDFVQAGSTGLSEFKKKMDEGDLSGAIQEIGKSIGTITVEVVKRIPDAINAGVQLLKGIAQGIAENLPVVIEPAKELVMQLAQNVIENAPLMLDSAITLVSQFVDWLMNGLSQNMDRIGEFVSGIGSYIGQNADKVINAGIELAGKIGTGLVTGIPQFLKMALPLIEQFSEWLRQNAGKVIDAGRELVLNIAQGIADSIPVLVEHVPEIIINIAGIINDNAPKLLATGIEIVAKLVGGIIAALPVIIENIPKIIQAIVSVFMAFNWLQLGANIINFIKEGIIGLVTAIPDALRNIAQTAIQWLSLINWSSVGADIIDLIIIGIQSLASALPTLLQTIFTSAITLIKSIDWLGVGIFVVQGLITGIGSIVGAAVEAIVGIGKAILNGFKTLFGINSPSTVMAELGGFIVEGLMNALSAIPGKVKEVFSNALKNISGWAGNALKTAKNAGKNVKDAVVNGFNTMKDKASNILSNAGTNISNSFSSISSNASDVWGGIKDTVGGIVESLGGDVESKFTSIQDTASNIFESIKDAMSNPIETAKETIGNIIDSIKDLFDFEWKLPDIELPHLSVWWEDLGPISIPHVSVDWYAKAYANPYLFTSPTVVGGMGFGDRAGEGGEMVYGHDNLMDDIRSAVNSEMGRSLAQIYGLLEEYLPEISTQKVVLDSGTIVGSLAPAMDTQMGIIAGRRKRGN